jgi:hypothetical protein
MPVYSSHVFLKEAVNLTSLDVDIDVEVARGRGETRDGLDIGSQGIPRRLLVIMNS